MSRLTKYDKNRMPVISQEDMQLAIAKLAKFEDAEEQGRLMEFPVMKGTKLFGIRDFDWNLKLISAKVIGYMVHGSKMYLAVDRAPDWIGEVEVDSIGKIWFKTKEEAEKKLQEEKKLKEEKNGQTGRK